MSDTRFIQREHFPQVHAPAIPGWMVPLLPFAFLRATARALIILLSTQPHMAVLCLGSHQTGLITCLLNRVLPLKNRKILLWGAFVEADSPMKQRLVRYAIEGASFSLVWSRAQVRLQSEFLSLPQSKFIPTLYKANHSSAPPEERRLGGYVFSGGNSQRDYGMLFEAVRGTDVQLVVSTTKSEILSGLDVPDNVLVLQAREPAFMRLMAGSRFVVYTIHPGRVRGAAEASIANAMWHGRAVICAENITAADYVVDGGTGYVVPAGDVQAVRERILELWQDPVLAEEMGARGHERASKLLTHEIFMQRLLAMAGELALSDPAASVESTP